MAVSCQTIRLTVGEHYRLVLHTAASLRILIIVNNEACTSQVVCVVILMLLWDRSQVEKTKEFVFRIFDKVSV